MAKLLKIDFINSITDLGGRWSEDRDCEKMDDLKTKLKVDVTKDGCTETKGFGAISGTTICYCHTDLCNSSERIHILNTKTWFCGFLILLYFRL